MFATFFYIYVTKTWNTCHKTHKLRTTVSMKTHLYEHFIGRFQTSQTSINAILLAGKIRGITMLHKRFRSHCGSKTLSSS